MKKLAFVAAAALAGACFAESGIASANVVGYSTSDKMQTSPTEAMYSMMSVPFEKADGSWLSLNDIVFSNAKANNKKGQADLVQLWVWKESIQTFGYEVWFLKPTGWYSFDDSTISFDDAAGHPEGLQPGTTFWYYSRAKEGAMTTQTSGQVVPENTKWTITRGSYNFVGFPYPGNLKLNDTTQVDWGTATTKDKKGGADQILLWVWKDSAQQYGYRVFYKSTSGWKDFDDSTKTFEDQYPNGVDVGTGFWYVAKSGTDATFDVTFKSPIAK